MVSVYEMTMIILPVYAFITLYKRVKGGILDRSGALWRYAVVVMSPIIFYVAFFFLFVGIGELSNIGLVTEGFGRSFFILVGFGIIVWFASIFIFWCYSFVCKR